MGAYLLLMLLQDLDVVVFFLELLQLFKLVFVDHVFAHIL